MEPTRVGSNIYLTYITLQIQIMVCDSKVNSIGIVKQNKRRLLYVDVLSMM